MKIHEALTAVMRSVPVVRKEDRNTSQNFSFRGIDAVLSAVGPALREHGVVPMPTVLEHSHSQVLVGRNQTPMNSVLLLVSYKFVGPEGDEAEAVVPGEAMDAGDKGYAKAMSVALRTALIQCLALPTDERDADADSYERASSQTAAHEQVAVAASVIASYSPKSEADIARDDLRTKIRALSLDGRQVARDYLSLTGVEMADETDDQKIADFTAQLEPVHA